MSSRWQNLVAVMLMLGGIVLMRIGWSQRFGSPALFFVPYLAGFTAAGIGASALVAAFRRRR